MSANPFEPIRASVNGVNARHSVATSAPERRKRPRIRVHWPVLLFRNQVADAIATTTQDLSSSGFYCLTTVPLRSGEVLKCALKVPFHDPNGKHLERNLECSARVTRIEPQENGTQFGIAFHIEDYRFAELVLRQC